jgi:hypothetical protein
MARAVAEGKVRAGLAVARDGGWRAADGRPVDTRAWAAAALAAAYPGLAGDAGWVAGIAVRLDALARTPPAPAPAAAIA